MIIVTGGAGFIGSNIVKALNNAGHNDILVVDDLSDGTKFANIADCKILDYLDRHSFINRIDAKVAALCCCDKTSTTAAPAQKPLTLASRAKVTAIFHQGACSTTTEWDGAYMMQNNYEYSKSLLHYCLEERIPFIYASSAAVYGGSTSFQEKPGCEKPLNVYGYSKFQFDQYVRHFLPLAKSQIVGLRYFNVYGQREQHKGSQASVAFHLNEQIQRSGKIKLFAGFDGYSDGEQRRDFIYVEDVAAVNLWFWQHPEGRSGIFNLGTGKSTSFNDVARAVAAWHKRDFATAVEYIPFPAELRGRYQSFTEADISQLRTAGYNREFQDVAAGVRNYLDLLNGSDSPMRGL